MSKRRASGYASGFSRHRVKVKCPDWKRANGEAGGCSRSLRGNDPSYSLLLSRSWRAQFSGAHVREQSDGGLCATNAQCPTRRETRSER